jgi:hypothetical protein
VQAVKEPAPEREKDGVAGRWVPRALGNREVASGARGKLAGVQALAERAVLLDPKLERALQGQRAEQARAWCLAE